MNVLLIGDVIGKPGRQMLEMFLPSLIEEHHLDLVIANVENAAAGFGVTPDLADDFLQYGVHVMTGGNHTWDKKEIIPYFADHPWLLRPINMPAGTPGRGRYLARATNGVPVAVINAMGRVFMTAIDDPFRMLPEEIAAARKEAAIVFVDFHAEATSEKVAMGWHLDGKATAVVGTHTHVQTADERILPKGTAYLTDVGMTGPHDSIIGVEVEPALNRFLTALPQKFETATANPRLNAVVIEADEASGVATDIERISLSAEELQDLSSIADDRPVRSPV